LSRHEKLHLRRKAPEQVFSPTHPSTKPVTPERLRSNTLADNLVPRVTPEALECFPPIATDHAAPHSISQLTTADVDFELIWPDSEDLLQTLFSSDVTNQWQIPLGTLPFSATPSSIETASFETPSSFDRRPVSIEAIPLGGNHQAVQDVSKMISSVVSIFPWTFCPPD
jgi:hypothetical protein